MEDINLIMYDEVLQRIKDEESHLLVGNGFNRSLGINTSYDNIFNEMKNDDFGIFNDAENYVIESDYDLESFIGKLTNDINPENNFLKKYINNKVKLDFMKATHKIVKSELKNVYAEKNEGIFFLLKNFTNFFTLNYDSLLYLLLLNYKSDKHNVKHLFAFQPALKFIEEEMNQPHSNIFTEIKNAREQGILNLKFGEDANTIEKKISELSKTHLIKEIDFYSKTNLKGWSSKDIRKVVDLILEEEKRNCSLEKVDDGSKQYKLFNNEVEYVFDIKSKTQNLFFLHGAFHIYQDGKSVKKITQESDKALYERIEEILNDEDREIVCIFQSQNKLDVINENSYLSKCLHKLRDLSGSMVIIGSSLAENDHHIFEQINNSNIDNLYISSLENHKKSIFDYANKHFPSKNIYLFDALSISYKLPDDNL